jgi:cbb3-type cytochrome oxidase subunit 1
MGALSASALLPTCRHCAASLEGSRADRSCCQGCAEVHRLLEGAGLGRYYEDPVLKFFADAITLYGEATFEGPLLSIESVSSLAHYTDWIIGHVHAGALG